MNMFIVLSPKNGQYNTIQNKELRKTQLAYITKDVPGDGR